jgi:hypothetical protein
LANDHDWRSNAKNRAVTHAPDHLVAFVKGLSNGSTGVAGIAKNAIDFLFLRVTLF